MRKRVSISCRRKSQASGNFWSRTSNASLVGYRSRTGRSCWTSSRHYSYRTARSLYALHNGAWKPGASGSIPNRSPNARR